MTSVGIYVWEHDGSANYRLLYPAEQLQKDGYHVEVNDLSESTEETEVRLTDVVVVSRPIWRSQADLVVELSAMGIRVVVDLDDDIENLVPEHSLHGFDTTHLHRALAASSRLVVTTPELATTYGDYDPVVVPNMAADFMRSIEATRYDKRAPVIGWYGGLGSHPNDLQQVGLGVRAAMLTHPADFGFVGVVWEYRGSQDTNLPVLKERLKLMPDHPVRAWPFTYDDQQLWGSVASFDIGIAPLQLCQFNAAKSYLKGVEYASLGVPFIASPTPSYRRLSNQGVGLLAASPTEWKRQLLWLLREKTLREEQILHGKIWTSLNSYATRSGEFWSAWTE